MSLPQPVRSATCLRMGEGGIAMEIDYLRRKVEHFRRLAKECSPELAGEVAAIASEIEKMANELEAMRNQRER
jgi:hypothetical protein